MPLSYSALRPVPVNQTQEHLHGSSAVSGWDTARLRAHFRHPALPAAPQRPLRLITTFALSATRTLEPSPKRAKIPSALTCPSPVPLESRLPPDPHYQRQAGPGTGPGLARPAAENPHPSLGADSPARHRKQFAPSLSPPKEIPRPVEGGVEPSPCC